jgi:ribosomal protein S18 acetylase RimI-like enzyme
MSAFKIVGHLGPLAWFLERFNAEFRRFCSAIVWVEDGQVVGVVVGHPIGADARYWIVRNLAVRKTHRNRGIGRALMEYVIDKAVKQGAEKAIAMVRTNNAASLNLFGSFGFRQVAVTLEMRLNRIETTTPIVQPGYTLRPRAASEWRKEYVLAKTATPVSFQCFKPIRPEEFSSSSYRWLGNPFARGRVHRLIVEHGDQFIAALTIRAAGLWGEHHLQMIVHPRWRGQLEEMLISKALAMLTKYPQRTVNVEPFASHTATVEILTRYGFSETKRSLVLGLSIEELREEQLFPVSRHLFPHPWEESNR